MNTIHESSLKFRESVKTLFLAVCDAMKIPKLLDWLEKRLW